MVYRVNHHGEIARHMVAVGLLRACRVQVQTSVHVDHAGPKSGYGNVARVRQHIVPVSECGRRNRVRRDLEPVKPSTHQIGSHGADGENQDGSRDSDFLE